MGVDECVRRDMGVGRNNNLLRFDVIFGVVFGEMRGWEEGMGI